MHKDDATPYRADAWFKDGRDYHAVAATPAEALRDLAIYWARQDAELDKAKSPAPPK